MRDTIALVMTCCRTVSRGRSWGWARRARGCGAAPPPAPPPARPPAACSARGSRPPARAGTAPSGPPASGQPAGRGEQRVNQTNVFAESLSVLSNVTATRWVFHSMIHFEARLLQNVPHILISSPVLTLSSSSSGSWERRLFILGKSFWQPVHQQQKANPLSRASWRSSTVRLRWWMP